MADKDPRLADDVLRLRLGRWQRRGLIVAVLGAVGCGIAATSGEQAMPALWQAYHTAFYFLAGTSVGAIALLLLHHLSGGGWGFLIQRLLESVARTTPLVALMGVPLLFGAESIFVWTDQALVAKDPIVAEKVQYLFMAPLFKGPVPSLPVRAALYFACWLGLLWMVVSGADRLDRPDAPESAMHTLSGLSGPGLLLLVITASFASIDWGMSLEPTWFSTMYGLIFVSGGALTALALAILLLGKLRDRPPLDDVAHTPLVGDLGSLLLAMVMVWAYLVFSQFLIIWMANIPEETSWYGNRFQGGWQWVALLLLLAHFTVPFLLLLLRQVKRKTERLAQVALWLIALRAVDIWWTIAPAFEGRQAAFGVRLADVAAFALLGGLFATWLARDLARRPLVIAHHPHIDRLVAPERAHV